MMKRCELCGLAIPPDQIRQIDSGEWVCFGCLPSYTPQENSQTSTGLLSQSVKADTSSGNVTAAKRNTSDYKSNRSRITVWLARLGLLAMVILWAGPFLLRSCVDRTISRLVEEQPELFSPGRSQRRYVDSRHRLSILFPRGWTIQKSVANRKSIIIKASRFDENGQFATMIIYAWDDRDRVLAFTAATPREWFDLTYADTAVLLDGGETMFADERTIWMKFQLTGPLPGYAISYFLVHNDRLYHLFGNTIGNQDWFEQNEGLLLSAIKSFRFRI